MSEQVAENLQEASQIQLVASVQFERSAVSFRDVVRSINIEAGSIAYSFSVLNTNILMIAMTFAEGFGFGANQMEDLAKIAKKVRSETDDLTREITKLIKANASSKQSTKDESGSSGNLLGSIAESFKGIGQRYEFGRTTAGMAGKGGIGQLVGGVKSAIAPIGKGIVSAFAGGFSILAPQLLALTLIMKPISALLEGILGPLDPIIELAGAIGQILGMLLVPIVSKIMSTLMPLLPILINVVKMFFPIIDAILLPLSLMAFGINLIAPYLNGIIYSISWLVGQIANIVNNIISWVQRLIDGMEFLGRFGDRLSSSLDNFKMTESYGKQYSYDW